MFICICNAITERHIQSAVADGAVTLSDLQARLGVATCCGCCAETASEYLQGGRYAGQTWVDCGSDAGARVGNAANDASVSSGVPMLEVIVRRA